MLTRVAAVQTLADTVQITPEAVRSMLRDDAMALALGSGLVAAGIVTIAVLAVMRRRLHPLL